MILAKLLLNFDVDITTCILKFNEDKFIYTINNKFVAINDMNTSLINSYSQDKSCILDVNIENRIIGNFANGEIQEKEFIASTESFKFNKSKTAKYKQDVMPLVLSVALFRAYQFLNNIDSNIKLDIVYLVDKDEVAESENYMHRLLSTLQPITMLHPDLSFNIIINSVKAIPKGYSSFAYCMFDFNSNYRDINKKFLSQRVLVIDIDDLTTSCLLIDSNRLNNYYYKYLNGTEKILSNIRTNMILSGNVINLDDIKNGIGNADDSILGQNIELELKNFSSDLISNLLADLNNKNINLSTINGLLVSNKLFKDFNSYISNNIEDRENKKLDIVTIPDNIDLHEITNSNLLGLFILSDYI